MENGTRYTKDLFDKFVQWAKTGTCEYMFEVLSRNMKLKKCIAMINSSHVKVHMNATGTKNGNQDIRRTQKGLIQKLTWSQMPKEVLLKL